MNAQTLIEEGKTYLLKDDFARAEASLERALALEPGNGSALFELGKCFLQAGRYREAAERLGRALGSNGAPRLYAFLLLGKSLKILGEYAAAMEILEKAGAEFPGNEEIAVELRDVSEAMRRAARGRTTEQRPMPQAKRPALCAPYETLPVKADPERSSFPPHRVCITWLINNSCNYACSYCQNGFKEPAGFRHHTPAEWFAAWKAFYDRYGTCAVQLTGGEPAIYPDFFGVLKEVSKMHFVELQTNLSWEPEELISRVSPERVSRVGASFHQERAEFDVFLNKMKKLKDAGFKVEITYVAYPPFIPKAKGFLERAGAEDIPFSVLSFQGEYLGKRYPESYNPEEREALRELNLFIGNYAQAMAEWDVEHKVIVDKTEEIPGIEKKCRMGQMYAWLLPDGTAMRCCKSPTALGNILDGTFVLLEDAEPCKLKHCICWRSMVLGEEGRWNDRWPGTKERAQD